MNTKLVAGIAALTLATAAIIYYNKPVNSGAPPHVKEAGGKERTRFVKERMLHEFNLLKDPATGIIPAGIFEIEQAFAKTLPVKGMDVATGTGGVARTMALNNYIPAGPNNIGGRTRAVAYDRRYNGGSNRVIIAGSVSGGIMRSADGGSNWTRVSPENEIHNLTSLAQDPLNPDTWYAGGGESLGNTASELGAPFMGFGIYKSTNNGLAWTRLPLNTITNFANTGLLAAGTLELFDHPFDFVHAMAVNPTNSDLYIAGHRRLVKSTDGGATFRVVFEGTLGATSATGQLDVALTNAGMIYIAVNGGNPDPGVRGVWVSASGNAGSFSRIAGGSTLGIDSVADWRAATGTGSKRILIELAPSNNNIAYVFYENGLSSDPPDPKPEADFFRLDISGSTYTWTNRSANMPDIAGGNLTGSDPLSLQGGYNMLVAVKPDNPNIVFVGGTNLYRSNDGFATNTNTAWIGGYQTNFTYAQYPQSHSDMHLLTFNPSNSNVAICANDGGVQETQDITSGSVTWSMLPNYQTLQCYNVAIDPTPGRNNFASGSQDNGVRFRDKTGLLGTQASDSNNHRLLFSADGAFVGISSDNAGTQYLYESIQFGRIFRARLTNPFPGSTEITPPGLTVAFPGAGNEFGEFVTNLRLETDNSDDLYYANFNRLFRTTSASTVTRNLNNPPTTTTDWSEMTGVSQAVNPTNPTSGANVGIRGFGFSRGPYATSHVLYLGTTNGKIFRLDDPRNAAPTTAPVDITPVGLTGNVQDIATNPNNDDEIMAIVSNYNVVSIWWTKNAKAAVPTWKNAEGNLTIPSIRSCAIIVKKDAANQPVTEYYVGTSVGLYSTINLGAVLDANGTPTWLREGGNVLNFAVITSLAYRPTDNTLLVGTHGNGIYYTSVGTANFTPNLNTGIQPVLNDRNFIRAVYPTLSSSTIQFQRGNINGIQKIVLQLMNMKGQVVMRKETGYQNGTVDLSGLASGIYILNITSNDLKYRHVQKIIKN